MARVTVEDCLRNVKNRFELVLVASKRARELMLTGVEPNVPWGNDKATVVALREIAKGAITAKILDVLPAQVAEPEIVLTAPQAKQRMSTTITEEDNLFMVASEENEPVLPSESLIDENPAKEDTD